jgi:hypothetical protein
MAGAEKPEICVRLNRVVLTQKTNMGIQASFSRGAATPIIRYDGQ